MIIYNKIFVYSPLENLFAQRFLDSVGVKYINYNFSSQEYFKYPPLYHFSSCDVFLFNKINSLIEHIPSFKKHYPKSFYLSFYSRNDPIHLNRSIFYNTSNAKKNLVDSHLLRLPSQRFNIPNKVDISEINSKESAFFSDEKSFRDLFPFESV
tara:strand:+ start:13691 stop:14149 length:459 start_codon:yes stop_codon:yes gene_type:complete